MVHPPRCWGGGMPRAGQVKPPVVERLSDRMAIGVLTSTFPPELVDRVIAETGRREQRQRLLPARVVVWLVLAMALFGGQAYEEVARPLATPATRGAWYRDWRVCSIDGTCLDVPDTAAYTAAFGRPATGRGEQSAFPQVRLVGVAECGTQALLGAAIGPLARGETTLAREVLGVLGEGMLVLADRQFAAAWLWRQAAATGAQLVWRTRSNAVLPVLEALPDGSYLSQITAATDRRHGVRPTVVRVVEYTLGKDRGRQQQPGPYRLLTTVLDPSRRLPPSWPRSTTSAGSSRP